MHHPTLARFGTIKTQVLISSDDPLMNLTGMESTCPMYITERHTLPSTIENIDNTLLHLYEPVLIVLFDCNSFDTDANTNFLNATIE